MNDITPIVDGLKKPFGVALEGDYLYITQWGDSATAGSGSVVRVNKRDVNSAPVTIATGLGMPTAVAVDGEYVYTDTRADQRLVVRVKKDGSAPAHHETIASGLDDTGGVAVDGKFLYLTNVTSKIPPPPHDSVMKAKKDGSEATHPTVIADSGVDRPAGMVMDGEYLYITKLEDGSVARVKKVKSEPVTIATGLDLPSGVAKDREYLYITQDQAGSVVRAKKDGKDPSHHETVATGLKDPRGVAVDGDDLYIVNVGTDSVVKVRMRVPA
ncbi:hypothetical protein CG747_31305 [Streptomyces sp. CB02959]|uniref:hypothetical protein n=1 Tax=Streptomyces sp. CB02959 TaxID=2020330 RepID=UPI000C2711B4|nr:hypothetical protein [Streptomyces sp. CB02959]PJN36746.1 hypothetical protein CG747_31305 [Streptomyces sp. CB02959]